MLCVTFERMKNEKMKKKITFLVLLISILTNGQIHNFTITEIDSIVKIIDSTSINNGVEDFILHKNGNKKKVIGGGADWFYTDVSKTKLLKIIREYSLKTKNLETYYFFQDSLIYLETTVFIYTEDKKKIAMKGKYYFQNELLIFKEDNNDINFNPKIYLKNARYFLDTKKSWKM